MVTAADRIDAGSRGDGYVTSSLARMAWGARSTKLTSPDCGNLVRESLEIDGEFNDALRQWLTSRQRRDHVQPPCDALGRRHAAARGYKRELIIAARLLHQAPRSFGRGARFGVVPDLLVFVVLALVWRPVWISPAAS